MLKNYQTNIALNTLYKITLKSLSGLGEVLKPRISSIGGSITLYYSELEPVGLTLANIATKMIVAKDNLEIGTFESVPNYICLVQKTGTSTELVLTSIEAVEISTIS